MDEPLSLPSDRKSYSQRRGVEEAPRKTTSRLLERSLAMPGRIHAKFAILILMICLKSLWPNC